MGPIIALAVLAQAPGAGPRDLDAAGAPSPAVERCRAARQHYEALAFEDAAVQTHTSGKTIRKVIVVPGRIINIVVS